MGKVEDLRAIKDARFAAAQKTGPQNAAAPKLVAVKAVTESTGSAPTPPVRKPVVRPVVLASTESVAESLCGHRAIGGKTCIRVKGHDEASHKYAKS